MAFTGNYTLKSLGKYCVRLFDAQLLVGASGVIGLQGDAGADVKLPANFPAVSDAPGLTMSDLVEVTFLRENGPGLEATHIHVVKTDNPFRITFVNDMQQDAGLCDICIKYLHSVIR